MSCTALCIKIKRFYDTIPQFLIEEAARYRLPLIAVPFYHSYSDIMRVIFRELELRQLSNQAFVINETRKFCQLFTSNSGISSMLSMLSSYTASIILITDYNDKSPTVIAPNLNIAFLLFDCCIMLILNVSHNTVK